LTKTKSNYTVDATADTTAGTTYAANTSRATNRRCDRRKKHPTNMAEAVVLRRHGFQRGVDGELICANPRTPTCSVEGDLIGANLEKSTALQ